MAISSSLLSAGGPYLALPCAELMQWQGAENAAECQRLQHAGDGASVTAVGDKVPALVLGTPDMLYWWSTKLGGVLVRVVSFDAADDAVLASHLERLPKKGWESVDGTLEVKGPWCVFDSAAPGAKAATSAINLELAEGRYNISEQTWQPDDETELMLVRLTRG